ncbi:MAG: hypothetical protein HRU19_28060 [Pseudobacteriovorax sp.]|nr:hypothetical protein [Pseudobacteriovorax sp.]
MKNIKLLTISAAFVVSVLASSQLLAISDDASPNEPTAVEAAPVEIWQPLAKCEFTNAQGESGTYEFFAQIFSAEPSAFLLSDQENAQRVIIKATDFKVITNNQFEMTIDVQETSSQIKWNLTLRPGRAKVSTLSFIGPEGSNAIDCITGEEV